MEVDIQADFSEGQTLPSQAAMQPLVAQIMRAVTEQAAPPVRPAQQVIMVNSPSAIAQLLQGLQLYFQSEQITVHATMPGGRGVMHAA